MIGRFAPTPSGRMHLGNVASCLVAWLSARAQAGSIVLRIEDLDPRAQNPEAARLIMDDLAWLGLNWDKGPYYQSERTQHYLDAIKTLAEAGFTYPCFCTRSELHAASAPHASDGTYVYAGTCRNLSPDKIAQLSALRPAACRLRVPDASDPRSFICFFDKGYGEVQENLGRECGDFLIQRSDGIVAYQLAVVVDDAEMGVTEVVRGRDLLGSVARQHYIQDLLGYKHPAYGHIPLLIAPDGRRLSKRDKDLDLGALRQQFKDSSHLIGLIAYKLGFIERNEPIEARELVKYFTWDTICNAREDIVITSDMMFSRD